MRQLLPSHDYNMASDSPFRVRSVAEKPHQPRSFSFSKREFGNKCIVKRSFQPRWFDQWPWLDYNEENDSVLDEQPKARYTHCYGHSLNLACTDTIRQSKIILKMRLMLHMK